MNIDFGNEDERQSVLSELVQSMDDAIKLDQTLRTPGWGIIDNAMSDIEQSALDQLAEIQPGDDKRILAAHSNWYAAKHSFSYLREAIQKAIQEGARAQKQYTELQGIPENGISEDII